MNKDLITTELGKLKNDFESNFLERREEGIYVNDIRFSAPQVLDFFRSFLQESLQRAYEAGSKEVDKRIKNALDALEDMYWQYCSEGHTFMSAGEGASSVLEREGILDFDKAGRPSIIPKK